LASGGKIARRLSGGGTVYHDLGNLNFTFILPKSDFDVPYQLSVIRLALSAYQLAVYQSGRNDLLIDGRKFSGNAFYKAGSSAYHHGTLLLDCSMDEMSKYLTVEQSKLQTHGVQSVAARVVNLKSLAPDLAVENLERNLYRAMAAAYHNEPAVLDEMMLDQPTLTLLTRQFADEEWIFPKEADYTFSVAERFPWGGITVKLSVEDGVIKAARLFTDAMEAGLFTMLEQTLTGCPYLISAINGRIRQKLEWMRDPLLLQMTNDVSVLICGRIRELDRTTPHDVATGAQSATKNTLS
jgi:lipoate---protein ligase